MTYDTELTYDKLRDAALLLQQNPRLTFLATHGDLVCPVEHGFVPDSGCILSVLEQTTGRTPGTVFGIAVVGARDRSLRPGADGGRRRPTPIGRWRPTWGAISSVY